MCECECTRARRGRRVNQPPQDVFFFRFFFTLRVHFSKSGRLERLLPVAEERWRTDADYRARRERAAGGGG